MPKKKTKWVVVADGAAARILRADGATMTVLRELQSAEAHLPSRELVSDKPGRSQESAMPGRHAVEPKTDPHQKKKQEFAQALAAELNRAAARQEFDALVLVAPARTMGELRQALEAPAKERLTAELVKDLTKVAPHDLAAHLEDLPRG